MITNIIIETSCDRVNFAHSLGEKITEIIEKYGKDHCIEKITITPPDNIYIEMVVV